MPENPKQVNDDMPEIVYHYTTMGTMMKIAEEACIWATSIDYLNDVSEGDYFQQLARQRIPQYKVIHPADKPTILDDFLKNAPETFQLRPFVASFSQDGDSLPQWRSYCPTGNGVAIGFSVDCLERSVVKATENDDIRSSIEEATFVKVGYLNAQTPESLDAEITATLKLVSRMVTLHPDTDSGRLFQTLMHVAACSKKHISFSSEQEFRLVLHSYGITTWMQFRPSRSTLIPYIPLSIPRISKTTPPPDKSSESPNFIKRIVIGPSPNNDLSQRAVDLFLRKLNMSVEVVSSSIPYRDW
jgi:hypothetical protein